jgi:hypothetical protein
MQAVNEQYFNSRLFMYVLHDIFVRNYRPLFRLSVDLLYCSIYLLFIMVVNGVQVVLQNVKHSTVFTKLALTVLSCSKCSDISV